jgi:hypothetical protein
MGRTRTVLDAGPLCIGFYTSGQLFLEEYYTPAVISKAGIGTPHTEGNTRLCTATAAAALKETFGSDGQPACYRRPTKPARRADLDLAPRNGTNLALVNGILQPRHSLMEQWGKPGSPLYSLLGLLLAAGIGGSAALLLHQPLLLPSLRPTLYLAFETPTANSSVPNMLVGHGVALLIALAALLMAGLAGPSVGTSGRADPDTAAGGSRGTAVTSPLLMMLDATHPPAGATSPRVTLGLLKGLNGAPRHRSRRSDSGGGELFGQSGAGRQDAVEAGKD